MSDLLVSLPSDPGLRDAVGDVDGVEFVEWDLDAPAPREQLDIVVPPYWGGARPLAQLAGVEARLVQWQSIGYNGVSKHLPEGLPLANAATVHEGSTAELAMALALAAQRGIPQFVRDGEEERWQLRSLPSLADRRVLLIGYGGVSQAIEARLAGFEVEITRLARTARREENLAGESVEVRGFESLHESLAEAEIVMLAVPLTDGTRGLIDAAALAAMPDGALLVNVARGPVVDTAALVAELQSGRLRAALDVTDPEPLPAGHPLWTAPNVLITPHVGGDSSAMLPRMSALIRRQIAHLQRGETPENIVLGSWERRSGSPTP
ncbi:2-hydroxyacid dehydrogenase [Leucobacter chromiiresistens]|uniref:Phosphoglycerate dehydrogenase n=1 Tax=Leucobacter chromiiresistens TaxID=1079994 RepID=A0A1H0YCR0_9MICO|nr:2-hydroxyacid dehydrogenase [Leucobacter chromiiresistens]SDQ12958.1 Phosphoglycerate dehydrogenase [Leucobacter chromiiresistens]